MKGVLRVTTSEVRQLVAAELKTSGKWKQGRYGLGFLLNAEDQAQYCVLGVIAELAIKNGVEVKRDWINGEFSYDDESQCLPPKIQEWVGFSTEFGELKFDLKELLQRRGLWDENRLPPGNDLAGANDYGISFEEIAKWIEEDQVFLSDYSIQEGELFHTLLEGK